jgi:ubiquinone biosynthesis monooxygenase Coq7
MINTHRHYSTLDRLCIGIDQAVRAVVGQSATTGRVYPAASVADAELNLAERKQAAGLMRINHAGEVAAQALYHSQSVFSRRPEIRAQLQQAAIEEGDHLAWCSTRLSELGSHTSYLNPVWYLGSFAIGMVAGYVGDQWSLGFVAETESQVVKHLESHLALLPEKDQKSREILKQMQEDEAHHRDEAMNAGAKVLPSWIKKWMSLTSKMMVKTAYWV